MWAHETRDKPFAACVFQLSNPAQGKENKAAAVPTFSNPHVRTEKFVQDSWDLRTVLGRGAFSEVRLGIEVETGERRAIKVINTTKFAAFQRGQDSRLSLRSEAETLSSIDHPGIVRVFEWFEAGDKLYLIIEFIPGGDLLGFLMDHGHLAEDVAQRFFPTVAECGELLTCQRRCAQRFEA